MKKVLIVVLVAVIVLLAYAATRPDSFRIQRTAIIKAPPEKVFALINDLDSWRGWSPWEKKDPAMKRSMGQITAGKGAVYEWAGNREVGKGRMEIIDAAPPEKLTIRLDFIEPFAARNTAEFTLRPGNGGTELTWAMFGPSPYLSKLVGIFFDMDAMVGKDFEAGLASLKSIAEQRQGG